ncbi:hypothetical protein P8452_36593 [Trifolium repens]|nr:hypothetical protein P8452_36593 [Trifolium repens]
MVRMSVLAGRKTKDKVRKSVSIKGNVWILKKKNETWGKIVLRMMASEGRSGSHFEIKTVMKLVLTLSDSLKLKERKRFYKEVTLLDPLIPSCI